MGGRAQDQKVEAHLRLLK